jgi:hypothetical protein
MKEPLAIPRRKWKDNVKIDVGGKMVRGVDWIHMV